MKLLLVLNWWCCHTAAALFLPRSLLQEPVPDGCQTQVDPFSLDLPASAVFQFSLFGEGTRNYTCLPNGQAGQSLAYTRLSSENYTGMSVQPNSTTAVATLYHVGTGQPAGQILLDTTVPGSVVVTPAKPGQPFGNGRYIIRTTGDLPRANYVLRRNSTGGAPPTDCNAPPGEFFPVPSAARFDYFLCT